MISQENTDERYKETSTNSYDTDSETTMTVTFKIKMSTGKKLLIIFLFQHFSLENEYYYVKSVLYFLISSYF